MAKPVAESLTVRSTPATKMKLQCCDSGAHATNGPATTPKITHATTTNFTIDCVCLYFGSDTNSSITRANATTETNSLIVELAPPANAEGHCAVQNVI